MGDDGEQRSHFEFANHRQQVQRDPNSNQHSGLLPTDEQDAYKRSAARASRRSRAQRTSYLVATGHLDPEETQRLNRPIEDTIFVEPSSQTAPTNTAYLQRDINNQHQPSQQGLRVSTKRSNFEQSFLEDLNRTLANSPVTNHNLQHLSRSMHNASTTSGKKNNSGRNSKRTMQTKKKGSQTDNSNENDNSSKGKFRQTYTEVTLPMKTSPAFEYILKDNRRRNKRCCLWFLYSTLMTICLLVIIWASIMISRSTHRQV